MKFSPLRGEDLESIVTVSPRRYSNSHSNSRIPNFNLRTFLQKVSGIFPFACDLTFFIQTFSLRKSYRWYMYFMNDG